MRTRTFRTGPRTLRRIAEGTLGEWEGTREPSIVRIGRKGTKGGVDAAYPSLMPDPTVRFAAGSLDRPRSGVWRLWVHGSDAYLGARVTLGTFKLSMHESGGVDLGILPVSRVWSTGRGRVGIIHGGGPPSSLPAGLKDPRWRSRG